MSRQSDLWAMWSVTSQGLVLKKKMLKTLPVGQKRGINDKGIGRGEERREEEYERQGGENERERSAIWFPVRQSPTADMEGIAGKQAMERSLKKLVHFCFVTSFDPASHPEKIISVKITLSCFKSFIQRIADKQPTRLMVFSSFLSQRKFNNHSQEWLCLLGSLRDSAGNRRRILWLARTH